jgi:hypothetical protein
LATRTLEELGTENLDIAEMATNGKLKADGHANEKVAKPLEEEKHGYEFLGP